MICVIGIVHFTPVGQQGSLILDSGYSPWYFISLFSLRLASITLLTHLFESSRLTVEKRLRHEQELSNDRLQMLNETNRMAKIGGWTLIPASDTLWWSEQTYHIHELPVDSPIQLRDAINFYEEEVRSVVEEAVEDGVKNRQGWNLELPFRTAKGHKIWVHAVGECCYNSAGEEIIRGTLQDITLKKETEQALKKNRDKALIAAAAKTQFLANMSHEIRTPMNGVLGNAELLAEEELTDIQAKYVSTIIQSGHSMMQILNDILDFTKIEAGKLTLDEHHFNLRDQLHSVYQLYESSAHEKGLRLILDVEAVAPEWICSDSTRIRQILSNLVSNGIKFSAQGVVALSVKVVRSSKSEITLFFEVRDSGIGIDKKVLSRLFSEFTQADISTTRDFGGSGLGLAICQRLAYLMGTEIKVKSTPGSGSVFYFQLNVRPGHCQNTEEKSEQISPSCFEGVRILLVDDNGINRDLALAYLRKLGAGADEAANGEEAVAAAKTGEYQLIFMDCQMPVMDGFEATRMIRLLHLKKQPVIIAMTANAMAGDRELCLGAGMDGYISKPISKKKIAEVSKKWSL